MKMTMKKGKRVKNKKVKILAAMIFASLGLSGLVAEEVSEPKLSGNVELLSSYIDKGATWNDGFVLQPSVTLDRKDWL